MKDKAKGVEPKKEASGARDRILMTATRLFYARGIRSTGIDLIIAESGVAKMTFYRHFPSKQVLILEYLQTAQCLWFDHFVADLSKKSKDPRKRLLLAFDLLEDWFNDKSFDGCALVKAAGEGWDRSEVEQALARTEKNRIAQLFTDLARDAGLRRPELLGEQWVLLIDGAIVRAQIDANPKWAKVAKSLAEFALKN